MIALLRASSSRGAVAGVLTVALLVTLITSCSHEPPASVVSLLDQVPDEATRAPWRVLTLADSPKRFVKEGEGLGLQKNEIVHARPRSIIRLEASTHGQGPLLVVVSYHKRWQSETDVELRVLSAGAPAAIYCRPLDGRSLVFETECPPRGPVSLELVHTARVGTPLPIARVAVGEIVDNQAQGAADQLKSILEWIAMAGWDAGRELPVSRRLPVSMDLCTRDCVVLGPRDTLEIPLPPEAATRPLAFGLMDLGLTSDTESMLRVEAMNHGAPVELGRWSAEETRTWLDIGVPPDNIPTGSQVLRFSVTGAHPLVAIAEPVLLGASHPVKGRWNLVLIDLDTARADRLGCYGYKERPTSQRLDSLLVAKGFSVFDRAIASSSWTLASTANFLSSRYLHEELEPKAMISTESTMLAEVMRSNGYYCAGFTAGGLLRTPGFERGFHEYHWARGTGRVEESFPQASEWLRQTVEPFFLFLHTYEAHLPYTRTTFCEGLSRGRLNDPSDGGEFLPRGMQTNSALSREESLYVEALYDGGVRHACDAVADVFALMDDLHLWDRTVVVVLSDHGEEFWEHFRLFATHCHSLYQELLDVPFLLYSPEHRQYRRVPERVSLVDLVPTIADILRLRWNGEADGVSLVPLMQGRNVTREIPLMACMAHDAHGKVLCILENNVKYIEGKYKERQRKDRTWRSVGARGRELYQTDSDPREAMNLARTRPDLADSMARRLAASVQLAHPPVSSQLTTEDRAVSPELSEQLRALGYLSSE